MTENEQEKDAILQENNEGQGQEESAPADTSGPEVQPEAGDGLSKLKADLEESRDKYLRLFSDFENFRRRTSKERYDLIQSASKDLIVDLLPVLDDFERALQATEASKEADAIKEGIVLVYQKFAKLLESKGLKPFESKGKDFDTEFHEAITEIPAPEESLKGKIVDEVERGYMLHDKVIRFAKVVVGK